MFKEVLGENVVCKLEQLLSQNSLRNVPSLLKEYGGIVKDFFSKFKDIQHLIKADMVKSVVVPLCSTGIWIFNVYSFYKSYQTFRFVNQAKKDLAEKKKEIEEIEEKLNSLKREITTVEIFSDKMIAMNQELSDLKAKIDGILAYIQQIILKAEQEKKTKQILACFSGAISLVGGVGAFWTKSIMLGVASGVSAVSVTAKSNHPTLRALPPSSLLLASI